MTHEHGYAGLCVVVVVGVYDVLRQVVYGVDYYYDRSMDMQVCVWRLYWVSRMY